MSSSFRKFRSKNSKSEIVCELAETSKAHANVEMGQSKTRILCVGGKGSKSVTEIYNLSGNSKKKYPDLLSSLSYHCALKLHDVLYCVGGSVDNDWTKPTNRVYRLDLKATDLKWEQVSSMIERRSIFGAAIFLNKLVVSGGCYDGNTISAVDLYKPRRNCWKKISPMLQCRSGHALVAAASGLFAIGGWDENASPLLSVEHLDKLDGNWKEVQPMTTERVDLAAVYCHGFIYAIGGWNGKNLKTVEKYDPNLNQWSHINNMNVERLQHASCVLQEKIFVAGGHEAGKTIECYDATADQWSIVDEMEADVSAHALVAI